MKRPKSIYFLTFVYAMIGMLVIALIIVGQKGLPGIPLLRSPFYPRFSFIEDKVILIAVGILIFLVAAGIWRGASWARNLSLLLTGVIAVIGGTGFLKVFTIFSSSDLLGLWSLLYIAEAVEMLISAFLFYVTLRPEIGRFCKIIPEKQGQ
jgi:hypothetical protein